MPVPSITAEEFVLGTLAAVRARLPHNRLLDNRVRLCKAFSKAHTVLEIHAKSGEVDVLFNTDIELNGFSPTVNRAIDSLIKEGKLEQQSRSGQPNLLLIPLNKRQAVITLRLLPGDDALWGILGEVFAKAYGFVLS